MNFSLKTAIGDLQRASNNLQTALAEYKWPLAKRGELVEAKKVIDDTVSWYLEHID